MKTDKKAGSITKKQKTSATKESSQKTWKANAVAEKKVSNAWDTNVSVFTRTTNPKVIIQSESIKDNWKFSCHRNRNSHKLIKFVCFIVICLIVLMTFFLSLKTYNIVNNLSNSVNELSGTVNETSDTVNEISDYFTP